MKPVLRSPRLITPGLICYRRRARSSRQGIEISTSVGEHIGWDCTTALYRHQDEQAANSTTRFLHRANNFERTIRHHTCHLSRIHLRTGITLNTPFFITYPISPVFTHAFFSPASPSADSMLPTEAPRTRIWPRGSPPFSTTGS